MAEDGRGVPFPAEVCVGGGVLEWVLTLVGSPWTYAALALVLAVGAALTFLPSQSLLVALTTLVVAGYGASRGLVWLFVAACVGIVAGDVMVFRLAGWLGLGAIHGGADTRLGRLRAWVRGRLETRPRAIMITARLIPLGRLATTLACADARVPLGRFATYSAMGAAVWAGYSMAIAAATGRWAEQHPVLMVVVAVVVATGLGMVLQVVQDRWAARTERRR